MTKKMSILLILLASTNLMAKNTSSAKADQTVKKGAKKSKDWSVSISNTVSSNLYKTDNPDHYASNVTAISLGAKFGPGKIRLSGAINKPLTDGERDEKVTDLSLGYGQSLYKFNSFTRMSGSMKVTIPTSETSRERADLRTALTVATPISWDATQAGLQNAYVSYTPFAKKSFHRYEVATYGASNREWIVGNSLGVGYSLTSWMSIDFSGSYSRSFTYQGNSTDSYSLDESVSFSLPMKMGLTVGHSIGGSPLAPNGRDTEIDLFDSKKATVYATLSISL
jgi:hypothetical protein